MAVPIGVVSNGQSLDIGQPVALFQTHLLTGGGGLPRQQYAVSADGQRFLINVVADEATVPSITIVQNWTAALTAPKAR